MAPLRTEVRAAEMHARSPPRALHVDDEMDVSVCTARRAIALRQSSGGAHPQRRAHRARSPEHPPWVGSATKVTTPKNMRDIDRVRERETLTHSAARDFALFETVPFTFPGTYHPRHADARVEVWRRLLAADVLIDGPLRDRLTDGSIRLLKASWLLDTDASDPHLGRDALTHAPVLRRRQELPRAAFCTAAEAYSLLARRDRSVLALSAAWLTPIHPDPHGHVLAALRRYLGQADARGNKCAVLWAYACVPQPPFDLDDDRAAVGLARNCWAPLFASFTATCVLRCADLKVPSYSDGSTPAAYADAVRRPYEQRLWPMLELAAAGVAAHALEGTARAGHGRTGEVALPERLAVAVATRPKLVDITDGGVRALSARSLTQLAPHLTSLRAAREKLGESLCMHRSEKATARNLLSDLEMRIAPVGLERCPCCKWNRTHTVADGAEPAWWQRGAKAGRPSRGGMSSNRAGARAGAGEVLHPRAVVCDAMVGPWAALPNCDALIVDDDDLADEHPR